MEPDPFDQQQDSYMMGFDQMQYTANPFGIPGPYGPMGPDPMGPMPGQMPVPRARATVAEFLVFPGAFFYALH